MRLHSERFSDADHAHARCTHLNDSESIPDAVRSANEDYHSSPKVVTVGGSATTSIAHHTTDDANHPSADSTSSPKGVSGALHCLLNDFRKDLGIPQSQTPASKTQRPSARAIAASPQTRPAHFRQQTDITPHLDKLPPELRHAATTGTIAAPVEVHKFTYGESNPTCTLTDKNSARYVLRKKPRPHQDTVASSPTAACSPCPPTPPSQPHGTAPFAPSPTCTASIRFRSGSVIMGSARIYILSTVAGKQAEAQDKDSGKRVGPIPEFGKLVKWFSQNLPADKNRIVHGDYKIDNLIFHTTEPYVIESSTIPLDSIAELRRRLYDPEERVNAARAWLRSSRSVSELVSRSARHSSTPPDPPALRSNPPNRSEYVSPNAAHSHSPLRTTESQKQAQ
ncbi:hypothetical protein V8E36_009220 [Tilletia maclaganii]